MLKNLITMKKMLGTINAQMLQACGFLSSIKPCWWKLQTRYVSTAMRILERLGMQTSTLFVKI